MARDTYVEFEDPEIIQEFVVESTEHLEDIENQLLTIEASGADIDIDLVNTVFRGVHSIKGAAGFLALTSINELAHSLENVLNLMRERQLVPTPPIIDVMLRSADQLQGMLGDVENSNEVVVSEWVTLLESIADGTFDPDADGQESTDDDLDADDDCELSIDDESDEVQTTSKPVGMTADESLAAAEALIAQMEAAGTTCIQSLNASEPAAPPAKKKTNAKKTTAGKATKTTDQKASTKKKAAAKAPVASAGPVAPKPSAPVASKPPTPGKNEAAESKAAKVTPESSIRVSVESLDRLMNLAGELVLGRNQLLQTVGSGETTSLEAVAAKINQVTCEMQDAIMQTRMQPIGNVFTRFTRVVRDLSAKLGKQCTLDIEGKEVEVDKTIVEAIADPLTHLVRNAVDHGLEMPNDRTANGKPAMGKLRLRAFHQSGKVCIEISDDGGGINVDFIKSKAVEKGLITRDQAAEMLDRDAYRIIFMPGFSTAATLSDVSGRGVGMDVVRTNIEKLGGTVEIDSKLGLGTKIQVMLPLTLAIIPSLIVRCGQDRFAIPQVSIVELVRVRSSEKKKRIDRLKDADVLRLRGSLLPLVRLGDALQIPSDQSPANDKSKIANDSPKSGSDDDGAINIIVVETGTLRYGLVVDGLFDSEEIVVKPLGTHLRDCRCLSGATILGDGRVALILDIPGIGQHSELGLSNDVAAQSAAAEATKDSIEGDTQSLLLFNNNEEEQFAIPMGVVSRIERVDPKQLIRVGDQQVLRYQDSTLPLLCLEDHVQTKPRQSDLGMSAIVFDFGGRELGLVAPILHDIRIVTAMIDDKTLSEPGVIGSMVIDQVMTRLIDVYELSAKAHPEWATATAKQPDTSEHVTQVLLAEDSKFFRNQVKKYLEGKGYCAIEAEDGQEGWELLEADPGRFDLVVTDIQMPRMNGFELCEKIKQNSRTSHLPVIALTSLAGDEDMKRGEACGVDDYQIKMDREKLLAAVERLKLCVSKTAAHSTPAARPTQRRVLQPA